MTASVRETVLAALAAHLAAAAPVGARVDREAALPLDLPAAGLLILRDGEPGEPEVTLSPLLYHFEHAAELEAIVRGSDAESRAARLDALLRPIGAALAAARTLGGVCDWVEPGAPAPAELPVEGAESLKAAVIPITLHYSTADPLG